MWILGIPTYEGYGLTETSPALTLNSPQAMRFGSVGQPPEMQLRRRPPKRCRILLKTRRSASR